MRTVLEQIKEDINNLPDKSFNRFYTEYILAVTDRNIKIETDRIKNTGKANILSIDKFIDELANEF